MSSKFHHGRKSQKLDHKPHNSLGAYKIPKKGGDAPANIEIHHCVDLIKKEPVDFEEQGEEYFKPDDNVWVKEEVEMNDEVNEDLVDDLLEESKETEEELVKELLGERENKEEDEFGFLDDLMMDLKENQREEGESAEPQQNDEELQNDLLLANL